MKITSSRQIKSAIEGLGKAVKARVGNQVVSESEDMLVDPTRLRAALYLACIHMTGGDLLAAMEAAAEFYEATPDLLQHAEKATVRDARNQTGTVLPFKRFSRKE